MHVNMPCPDENVIVEHLHGRLDPPAARSLEQHVDGCGACAALLSELARMGGLAGVVSAPTAGSSRVARTVIDTPLAASAGASVSPTIPDAPAADRLGYRAPPSAAGQSLGRYVIERQIGAGAMGVVYLAFDPTLGRKVALKVLRPDAASGVEEANAGNARLLREARSMAALPHPNVVPLYDAGIVGEQVFLAMEYVEGQTLAGWLRAERRAWRDVVTTFQGAGLGLAAAHRAGILHRDFKPANVLVGADGRARVTDFGLSRRVAGELAAALPPPEAWPSPSPDPVATEAGALIGTPAYMAPEQLFLQPVDARADQFSFCAALYEALHGARPYEGASVRELRWRFASSGPAWPRDRRGVPRAITEVLMRGLGARPEERYPSMDALLAALDAAKAQGAEMHITINALCQAGAWFLHLLFTILWTAGTTSPADASAASGSSASADTSGGMMALAGVVVLGLVLFLGWSIVGLVWAPLNAVALWKRWSFARRSTMVYGAFAALSCIGLPYGIYAVWAMTRPAVREALKGR